MHLPAGKRCRCGWSNIDAEQRLDYVLLIPGIRSLPVLSDVEVLKVVRNGRFTSDHFGLSAVFKNHMMFEQ